MKKIVYTFFFYESLCQIARDKVMEGVSGHAADVLLSSSSIDLLRYTVYYRNAE